jgi:hypothetical protein
MCQQHAAVEQRELEKNAADAFVQSCTAFALFRRLETRPEAVVVDRRVDGQNADARVRIVDDGANALNVKSMHDGLDRIEEQLAEEAGGDARDQRCVGRLEEKDVLLGLEIIVHGQLEETAVERQRTRRARRVTCARLRCFRFRY